LSTKYDNFINILCNHLKEGCVNLVQNCYVNIKRSGIIKRSSDNQSWNESQWKHYKNRIIPFKIAQETKTKNIWYWAQNTIILSIFYAIKKGIRDYRIPWLEGCVNLVQNSYVVIETSGKIERSSDNRSWNEFQRKRCKIEDFH